MISKPTSFFAHRSFGRRRVVIRKGHVAQRFYVIFSGSACVTVSDDEQTAVFTKPADNTVLRRGDFFGVSGEDKQGMESPPSPRTSS